MNDPKRARTGARRAGAATPARRGRGPQVSPPGVAKPPLGQGRKTRHRGVHWQETPAGIIRWWNDDARTWVRYRPGADAPPPPPGWAVVDEGGPATNKAARAGWRTPYRLVPIILIVVVLGVAIVQASQGSGGQGAAEAKAADKLVGKCLKQNGITGGHPRYSAAGMACTAPGSAVRVVRVLPGTPGSPPCPAGDTGFVLPYLGVRYPHVECVVPVSAGP